MKRVVTFAMVLAVLVSAAPQARAFGVGVYADGGVGDGDSTVTGAGARGHASAHFGAGLALDTSLARDIGNAGLPRDRFNYRLKAGYQRQDWDDDVLLNAGKIDAILGVKLTATPNVRLWAGPLVRLQYLWGTERDSTSYLGFAGHHEMKNNLSAWGAGAGVALGVNFTTLGVGLEAGYVYNLLFGSAAAAQDADRDFDATEGQFYGSIVLMFR